VRRLGSGQRAKQNKIREEEVGGHPVQFRLYVLTPGRCPEECPSFLRDDMELRWNPPADQPFRRSYTIEWVSIGFLEWNNRSSCCRQAVGKAFADLQSSAADTWSDEYPKVVPTLNQPRHDWHKERNVPTALEHRC
jgi:hypothetical protein